MNLEEFKNENNIIDPNLKRQMQTIEGQTPGVKRKVTPQEMGFTHEEEKKIRPIDPILDNMDKAIARKQQEAIIMSQAIEESDGEGLSKDEFEDVLAQNKDMITDEPDGIPVLQEYNNDDRSYEKENNSMMLSSEKPSTDIFDELEKEEIEDGEDEVITPEQQYENEQQSGLTSLDEEIDKDDKLNDDPFDNFESGDIDFDEEINDLDENVDQKTAAEKEEERNLEKLRKLVREKINPVSKKYDISTFSIVNKPAANVVATPRDRGAKIVDWVLMSSCKPIYMRAFTGTEIERLASGGKGRTRLNKTLDVWQLIYDHIVDKNKPTSLEEWAKSTSFLDIDHIYMAIYKANFDGSNYMPYNCTNKNCKEKMFLSEDIDIMDMCKFKDIDARKKFDGIIGTETTKMQNLYSTEVAAISENYAFRFREPSIYNVVFESAVLEEEFITKFGDLVSICAYIDEIYMIDEETRTLRPVRTNIYPNNMKKTAKARIISYSKIISSLSCDQYNTLIAYMNAINTSGDELTYQLPAVTCPACKTEIPARQTDAQSMVFSRHQLAALATY